MIRVDGSLEAGDELRRDTAPSVCRRDGPLRGRGARAVVLLVCVVAVLGVYIRSATSYGKPLRLHTGGHDFQNLQADAFLAGQLNLLVSVPPSLAALPDPYDPVANASYRRAGLHDLAYAHGKLYTYNGPAPVLLLDIPFRLLRLGQLAPAIACLIFCTGGFLASVRAFQHTARRFVGPLTLPVEAAAIVALGLAGPMAWIVYVGRGYEVSIASGYFMVSIGLLFLSRALFSTTRFRVANLFLAGGFFSGAIAARASLIGTMLFVLFALTFIWRGPAAPTIRRPQATAALVLPCAAIGLALAWYNWVRFGSVTELGANYMLSGENVRFARSNEVALLRRGLFQYVLSPARVEGGFPWFRLRSLSFPVPIERSYLLEPVAGILPNMPAIVAGFVVFFLASWRRLRTSPWFTAFVLTAVADGFVSLALVSFHFHGATMRYSLDFVPPLLFASVLGAIAWLRQLEDRPRLRLAAGAGALAVVAWSVFFALVITTYPCTGTGSC